MRVYLVRDPGGEESEVAGVFLSAQEARECVMQDPSFRFVEEFEGGDGDRTGIDGGEVALLRASVRDLGDRLTRMTIERDATRAAWEILREQIRSLVR